MLHISRHLYKCIALAANLEELLFREMHSVGQTLNGLIINCQNSQEPIWEACLLLRHDRAG